MIRQQDIVRNPVLGLPEAQELAELPPEVRAKVSRIFMGLRQKCRENAAHSWARHKAPMAAYWKIYSVYFGHIARVLR